MKAKLILGILTIISSSSMAQTNTFPSTGSVGIGIPTPSTLLHLKSDSPYIRLEKTSSSYESGFYFTTAGNGRFYLYNDNDVTEALKIQAAGLVGEGDAAPRIQIPYYNKDIYFVQSGGNIGIGTTAPDYKLTVNGKIKAEEVQVVVDVPADYVFGKDYSLMPLIEVEKFVTENKPLPGMPEAQSLITNVWQVGEMNNKMLEKVEELTLYLIEIKKELDQVKKENKELKRLIQKD